MFGFTDDEAILVLRRYKWNTDKLQSEWFDKEKGLRIQCGMTVDLGNAKKNPNSEYSKAKLNGGYCLICYGQFGSGTSKKIGLKCGHEFCADDWTEYLKQRVRDGYQKTISAPCMQHTCNIAVPHSLFVDLLTGADMTTYMKYHFKSFTDDNRNVRWCPYQGCDQCIEYKDYGMVDISCKCGNSFCFKCGAESHRPCDCQLS